MELELPGNRAGVPNSRTAAALGRGGGWIPESRQTEEKAISAHTHLGLGELTGKFSAKPSQHLVLPENRTGGQPNWPASSTASGPTHGPTAQDLEQRLTIPTTFHQREMLARPR